MSRYYRLPDRRLVPSVSAIVGALSKPGLMYWSAKCVAECAYDQRDYWQDLDREPAIGWLKKAGYRSTKKSADKGRDVHLAIETGDWRGVEAYRPAYERMEADHGRPIFLHQEKVVWSEEGYAGKLDAIAEFPGLGVVVVDWKTTGAIRHSVELQLGGYTAAFEEHHHPLDGGLVVRLAADGTYEWREYDQPTMNGAIVVFGNLLQVHNWQVRRGEIDGATDIIDVEAA